MILSIKVGRFATVAALLLTWVSMAKAQPPQTLEVLPNGNVRLSNGPEIGLARMKRELQRMAKESPQSRFVLQPNPGTPAAAVSTALKEASDAGVNVGFVVGPRSE